jgi:hypothetical protein
VGAKPMVAVIRKLKYIHFRSAEGNGVTSIGYQWDKDTGNCYYQIARCNPKDVFCKRIAHSICEGRMYKYGPEGELNNIKDEKDLLEKFTIYHPDYLETQHEMQVIKEEASQQVV